uniref:(northern house mosquito) hypothetical protein n=1 Tax=Culex pipiens TaxID=7175 RepID=A0A8D8BWS2_CULPI
MTVGSTRGTRSRLGAVFGATTNVLPLRESCAICSIPPRLSLIGVDLAKSCLATVAELARCLDSFFGSIEESCRCWNVSGLTSSFSSSLFRSMILVGFLARGSDKRLGSGIGFTSLVDLRRRDAFAVFLAALLPSPAGLRFLPETDLRPLRFFELPSSGSLKSYGFSGAGSRLKNRSADRSTIWLILRMFCSSFLSSTFCCAMPNVPLFSMYACTDCSNSSDDIKSDDPVTSSTSDLLR